MFREMRRSKQQMAADEVRAILEAGKSGVLAVLGDEGYPYAVPLSYVFTGDCIYFHCAKSGHKLDAIQAYDKVSFCVINMDDVVPERYTTYYRSVIAFGRARVVEDADEKLAALRLLGDKYNPNQERALNAEVKKGYDRLHIVAIDVEHVTGKKSIELVRKEEA